MGLSKRIDGCLAARWFSSAAYDRANLFNSDRVRRLDLSDNHSYDRQILEIVKRVDNRFSSLDRRIAVCGFRRLSAGCVIQELELPQAIGLQQSTIENFPESRQSRLQIIKHEKHH